jgi:hypothetical protein
MPRPFINKIQFFFQLFIVILHGQISEKDYIKHLIKKNYTIELENEKNFIIKDTFLFSKKDKNELFLSLSDYYYSNHELDSAIKMLDLIIPSNKDVFCHSRLKYLYYSILKSDTHLNDTVSNKSFYNFSCHSENFYKNRWLFLQAGIKLLNNKFTEFDTLFHQLKSTEDSILSKELYYLYQIRIHSFPDKRPFVAGMLSSVVPGMGKIYVGKYGQGLSSFLTCLLFFGLTTESFLRLQKFHPQTIIFASCFLTFYLSNIYGSVLSVKIYNLEKKLERKNNILVSLSVPIFRN